ncbi:hypothetical protein ACV4QK_16930 [Alteromonas macleodii]
MSKLKGNLISLNNELRGATALIEGHLGKLSDSSIKGEFSSQSTENILEKCEKIIANNPSGKPVLRIIHHLACSGGTLISKCLSALPNTFLLSEVHPRTTLHIQDGRPRFSPSDITMLSRFANLPNIDALSDKLFCDNVKTVNDHVSLNGGYLVLRDHSHSDYCVGETFPSRSLVLTLLEQVFDIKNIVSVRHPVDCYLSMKLKSWTHFSPPNFEEYCTRYLAFVSQFAEEKIVKYEDFVEDSNECLKRVSSLLDLPYSDDFNETFSIFNVTGDSGRGGETIAPKIRREVPEEVQKEISTSNSFTKLLEELDYKSEGA